MTASRQAWWFDGGCRPPPALLEVAVVHRGRCWYRDVPGPGDNNTAEWHALLLAVELALAAGATDPLFIGDSALVIAQASGRQRCRSPHLQPHLDAFRAAIAPLGRVRLRQVPRTRNLAGIALAHRNENARQLG